MNIKKSICCLFLFALGTVPTGLLLAQTPGSSSAQNSAAQSAVPRRVFSAVDPSDRVALATVASPWVKKWSDRGPVSGQTAAPHMLLLLRRSTEQQQALDEYLGDLQNPSSPRYRHWLTPTQFADSYGVNAEDVASVTSWLQSEGLSIDKVAPARNLIEFSGTASQIQQAFQTQIHRLTRGTETQVTAVSAVQVPRALAAVIRGLVNLDSAHAHKLFQPGPTGKYDPASHSIKPDFTVFDNTTPLFFVDPSDAATMYDTPNATLNPNYHGTSYDGTGVNVGVVGDSNVDLDLVINYRESFLNETAANVNLPTIVVDGNDPGLTGDEVESWLDLEILGGIAPKAKLYYYASQEDDLTNGVQTAITRAVNDNVVSILSISYGSCEAEQGTAGNAFFSEVYEQAAAQGITVTVSSGDSGSANCDYDGDTSASNGLAVNGIASTPYNIAVGGTDFDVLGKNFPTYVDATSSGVAPYWLTAHEYIPEEPWNDSTQVNTTLADNVPLILEGGTNIIAGGGGASQVYSKPAYQSALTPPDAARDLPDVSFLAANGLYGASWVFCEHTIGGDDCVNTNGQFSATTSFHGVGGTSAAAPAFAGMLALLEQSQGARLGQANNVLYQLAASKYSTVLHDVTTGNNSVVCAQYSTDCGSNGFLTGYDAGIGYDLATGLGSVDVAQMVSNWNSVTLTPTTTALTIGGSTSQVTATHGTDLHFQVAVNPSASTGAAALIANNSSVNGLLTVPLTGGAGAVTYNGLPGGQYTVYARYGGDTGDAASSSTPISVNISKEASTTALTLNAYDGITGATLPTNSPIPYGSYLFLDATVYGKAEGQSATQGIATGTITFDDGSASIGTGPLNSTGYASLSSYSLRTYPLTAGTHSLAASFPGDNSYNASTSAVVPINITKATPQIQIVPTAASTSTATYDLIQVVINEAGVGLTASGTVTLQSNGKTLGTAPLVDTGFQTSTGIAEDVGLATFNVSGSQLQPGVDTLTAIYGGDVNYGAGTGTTPLIVSQATFTLTTAPINLIAGAKTANTAPVHLNPLDYFTGTVNLKCTVTSAPANAIDPVTCSIPASVSISGLNAVTTTLTVNSVPPTSSGAYVITVTGVDAASGKVTSSATSTVTVTGTVPLPPAIAIANSGAITIAAGATTNNTSTLSITPSNGFTGPVDLKCTVSTTPTGANDPVTCALSSSSVTVSGSGAVTATLSIASTASTTSALERGFGAGNALLALVLVFVPARRRRRLAALACAFALIAIVGVVSGCGGNGSSSGGGGGSTPPPTTIPGTTAGVYAVTVTATGTNVTEATTTVKVTVN